MTRGAKARQGGPVAAALLAGALAGCAPAPFGGVDGAGPARSGTCGADALAGAIGAPLASAALPGDRPVRVIRPGDMVTQDFAPTRLNVELDAGGRIVALRCG